MPQFDPSRHPRESDGRFSRKGYTEPDGAVVIDDSPTPSPGSQALELASSPDVSAVDLAEMARSPHASVRLSAAMSQYPQTAGRAAVDPHPLIRAQAVDGWDVDADVRAALRRDREVSRVLEFIAR